MNYLKKILNNFDENLKLLEKKGFDIEIILNLKEDYEKYKNLQQQIEELTFLQKQKGALLKDSLDKENLQKELLVIKTKKEGLLKELNNLAHLEKSILNIPNLPSIDTPEGDDENENLELKVLLEKPTFNFKPKHHWELDSDLNFNKGTKLAGKRFIVLEGNVAKLERALINFMLDFNEEHGFKEVRVPHIVNREMLEGTGQLPKFEEDLFKIEGQDKFLLPTAEVALTNLFYNEVLNKEDLPINVTTHTPCFRKEVGNGGKDVKGLIRMHQFEKVELVTLTHPENSEIAFNNMINCVEAMLLELGLPHRQVRLCFGDLGFGAKKTIDFEVWFPAQNTYREISSVSTTDDFQAIRGKIRYKDDDKKNKYVHTLNGSCLAVGRTLAAILENYQKEDGTVEIPKALHKYL